MDVCTSDERGDQGVLRKKKMEKETIWMGRG